MTPFPDVRWGSARGWLATTGRRFAATPAGSALVRRLVPLDRKLLQRSGGRYTVLGPFGVPLLLLTTTGARSGAARTTPLMYLAEGDHILVAGSNFGQERHPAWSTNLLAHADASVNIGGEQIAVRARLLEGDERDRAWAKFCAISTYAAYQTRTDRHIRVFALERAE